MYFKNIYNSVLNKLQWNIVRLAWKDIQNSQFEQLLNVFQNSTCIMKHVNCLNAYTLLQNDINCLNDTYI